MFPKMKKVSKEEFIEFLNKYPRKLEKHTSLIQDPHLVSFNDFSLGMYPETVVACYYLEDNTDYKIRENAEEFIKKVKREIEEREKTLKEVVSQIKIDDITLGLGILNFLGSFIGELKQEIMAEVRIGNLDKIKKSIYVPIRQHFNNAPYEGYEITVEAILQDDKKSVKEFKVSYVPKNC